MQVAFDKAVAHPLPEAIFSRLLYGGGVFLVQFTFFQFFLAVVIWPVGRL
jgi:hypothetical protein